jgi:hypothetical protein
MELLEDRKENIIQFSEEGQILLTGSVSYRKTRNVTENATKFVLPFVSVFAIKNKMAQFTILIHF